MSRYTTTVAIGWETRNWRKSKRAGVWCRNYGLKPIFKNLFVGKLYPDEKKKISESFETLFGRQTDKFFIASICSSCHTNLSPMIQQKAEELPNFEIVTEK